MIEEVNDAKQAQEYFDKNNYIVVTNGLSSELVGFLYTYLQIKRSACKHLKDANEISSFDKSWGDWDDAQIPDTYSIYGDTTMDTLMVRLLPAMQKATGMELVPTYTYARIYKYGDELHRHKDRPSCEISCTLNLGGDKWPIFLEPSGEKGQAGVSVELNPGDFLAYRGTVVEHWREPFEGNDCGQVFCHYNNKNGIYAKDHKFDSRPMVGLPSWTRKN